MAEISNNLETNKAAWSFYSFEKTDFAKENEAIQKAGEPNPDQNTTQEANS